jgi:hypothetical protein
MPSNFFEYLPRTYYNLDGSSNEVDIVTNILANFSFMGEIVNNSSVYYEYDIQDGETPEILAHRFYEEPGYHWIIMRMNDVVDYKKDWPLDYKSLTDNIEQAYIDSAGVGQTGLEWAMINYHSYYKKETKTIVGSQLIDINEYEIDSNTYASLSESTVQYTIPGGDTLNIRTQKTRKTYYEYELEHNENKRTIKILKPEFVHVIKDEFVRVMSNA